MRDQKERKRDRNFLRDRVFKQQDEVGTDSQNGSWIRLWTDGGQNPVDKNLFSKKNSNQYNQVELTLTLTILLNQLPSRYIPYSPEVKIRQGFHYRCI